MVYVIFTNNPNRELQGAFLRDVYDMYSITLVDPGGPSRYETDFIPDDLTSLERLDCLGIEIQRVPKGLISLQGLLRVKLREESPVLPEMPSLEVLSCGGNRLTSIPFFSELRKLYIGHNLLTCLPEGMNHLVTLWCPDNLLQSIPYYPRLRKLDCDNNQLKSLPQGMTNLKTLRCSGNPLRTLPDDLTSLIKLQSDFSELGENNDDDITPQARIYHILREQDLLPLQSSMKSTRS